MKFFKTIFIALTLMIGNEGLAQVPECPANASPVVDMAGIINNDSLVNALNAQLDTLYKQTKNQIVVVTVNDMGGQDATMFAAELGRKWGVGGKELNNGVVIAVKPRNDKGSGEIGIATGYGVEGVLPDVWVKHLQNEYIVPLFKEGDYAGGIKTAIDKIVPVLLKEHKRIQDNKKNSDGKKKGGGNGWVILAVIAGVIALIVLLGRRRKKNQPSTPAQPQASRLAGEENAQPDEEPEENPEEEEPEEPEEEDDTPDPNAPKPYKYNYGGGDFGGGGASTKF